MMLLLGLGAAGMFLLPKLTGGKGIGEMLSGLTGGGKKEEAGKATETPRSTQGRILEIPKINRKSTGSTPAPVAPSSSKATPTAPRASTTSSGSAASKPTYNPAVRGVGKPKVKSSRTGKTWDPWGEIDSWPSRKK